MSCIHFMCPIHLQKQHEIHKFLNDPLERNYQISALNHFAFAIQWKD